MSSFAPAAALAALLAIAVAPQAALAQPTPPEAAPEPELPPPPSQPAPPAKSDAPVPEAEGHAKAADELLGRLAKTEDPDAAKRIAGAVQALWLRSGSDTADLLVSRAIEAQRKAKMDRAIRLLDQVVGLKPDFAEGWNRRATLHFLAKDYDQAMADIHETLLREPRHFGAWVGLARILRDSGLNKQALGAYRKALEIYPAIEGLKRQADDLALEVEGRPI